VVTIIHPALPAQGRLICGPRPPRPFRDGIAALTDLGVSTVACLLSDHEMPAELAAAYETAALEVLRFQIPDFGRPASVEALADFLDELLLRLRRRETIYLHCFAGLGRTGTVLACLLKTAGAPGDPVGLVRAIYDARALETEEQQRFARAFVPAPSRRPGSTTRPGSAGEGLPGPDDPSVAES
jgi:protein-tyrosine phosphatase